VKNVLTQILQGTLDLMILRTLATMGPQHTDGIANRLLQISDDALNLNQGTIYPALVRLEQHGWTRGSWKKTRTTANRSTTQPQQWIESTEGRDRALAADGRCS
jgi:DNA-binding PadR family transcriptional regulator